MVKHTDATPSGAVSGTTPAPVTVPFVRELEEPYPTISVECAQVALAVGLELESAQPSTYSPIGMFTAVAVKLLPRVPLLAERVVAPVVPGVGTEHAHATEPAANARPVTDTGITIRRRLILVLSMLSPPSHATDLVAQEGR